MSTRFKLYDKKGERFNIEINIEPNNKGKLRLSVIGYNNWYAGQCYDSIIPKNKYQKAFIAFWKKWHLNDMNAECEHQRKLWDTSKKIEVHEYTSLPILYGRQNKIEKLIKEKLISTGKCEVGTLIQTALSLRNKTFNDLTLIPRAQRYVGMVVTVLSDENNSKRQTDYWLSGGTLNSNWVQKTSSSDIFISGDDVE